MQEGEEVSGTLDTIMDWSTHDREVRKKVQSIFDEALDIYAADEFSVWNRITNDYVHPQHVINAVRIMRLCEQILADDGSWANVS